MDAWTLKLNNSLTVICINMKNNTRDKQIYNLKFTSNKDKYLQYAPILYATYIESWYLLLFDLNEEAAEKCQKRMLLFEKHNLIQILICR